MNVRRRLNRIESGPKGVVWGTNRANYIYYRGGVSRHRPVGRYWARVRGRLRFVSPGCTGVYGVSKNGQIWRYRGRCLCWSKFLSYELRKNTGADEIEVRFSKSREFYLFLLQAEKV